MLPALISTSPSGTLRVWWFVVAFEDFPRRKDPGAARIFVGKAAVRLLVQREGGAKFGGC